MAGFPSAGEGGGGPAVPNNFFLVGVAASLDLTDAPQSVDFVSVGSGEGGPYFAVSADQSTIDVLATGIYVVNWYLGATWTGTVAAPLNYFFAGVLFDCADGSGLASNGNFTDLRAIDQTTTPPADTIFAAYTTPPLQLQEGDSFQLFTSMLQAPAAGTAPESTSGAVVVVRIA